MSYNKLKFNVSDLEKMKTQCQESKDNMNDLCSGPDGLLNKLGELKQDWNTPAGEKFFTDLETNWTNQVSQYVNVLEAIILLLDTAITNYNPVAEEVSNLGLK